MDKLTITIEKIGDDYFEYVAEGGPKFGELRGCQSAEGIAKMIAVDLRSWIATQEQHCFERLHTHALTLERLLAEHPDLPLAEIIQDLRRAAEFILIATTR
jgi:hypothetical protein